MANKQRKHAAAGLAVVDREVVELQRLAQTAPAITMNPERLAARP